MAERGGKTVRPWWERMREPAGLFLARLTSRRVKWDPGSLMSVSARREARVPGTVLVVDDEDGVRQSFHRLLESRFRVLSAHSGERAIELVQCEDPDVVTLDLNMPGLNGVETLARIRELSPDLAVIIVTGVGSYDAAVAALRLRAFDFISKPFDSRHVLATIERAERSRRTLLDSVARDEIQVVVGTISANLSVLERGGSWDVNDNDRMRLDYACLLANAVRDRLDGDPLAWVERLVDALSDLRVLASPSPEEQASLESAQTLARSLRSLLLRRTQLC